MCLGRFGKCTALRHPCLQYHYKRAIEAGASKEEIAESIAIAMSISAGSKKAKYLPVINKLEIE